MDSSKHFKTPPDDFGKSPDMTSISVDSANSFRTPQRQSRKKSGGSSSGTPTALVIPASPFMQKLGYGTGVSVYLMKSISLDSKSKVVASRMRKEKSNLNVLSLPLPRLISPKGLHHSPWAVKKLNPRCDQSQKNVYQKRLHEEAGILKNLQHPNIVGYRAFTKASDGSMCLAMEYGGEKSLNDLIEAKNENGEGPFPAETILKVALSMARGLKYLHNEKKLLHGDIKSSNVVIKGDFEAIKICDVGVSLPLDENMTVSDPQLHYVGTEPWKPKEALEDDGVITDKSDIFAFGLTLWEMMTLAIPHLNLPPEEDEDESFDEEDFDDDAYYEALGTRPALNIEELGESYQKVIELFSVCTNEDPKKRPSAAQILAVLEAECKG